MNTLDNLIMVVGVFGSASFIIFILARYNYLIKKSYAERGLLAEAGKSRFSFRDIACILISLGIGLGIASIFTTMDLSEDTMDLLVYATLLICGGLGVLTAHHFRTKLER